MDAADYGRYYDCHTSEAAIGRLLESHLGINNMHKIVMIIYVVLYLPVFSFAYETRVVDGTVVSLDNDEWRFIVALKRDGGQFCGGSLIAKNWVLTAAHCLSYDNGTPISADDSYRVGIGSYNLNEMIDYGVKRFIVHPQYNAESIDNDIALIELDGGTDMTSFIAYDRLHTLVKDVQTKVAGWGNMNRGSATPVYPDNLREALVPVIDYEVCNAPDVYDGDITENMFCAGYLDGRRDGCQGDSGGPLVVDNTLVGIVSWGNGCGEVNSPGVYTKVKNYVSWIDSYIADTPKKQSIWIPVMMGDIVIFVPNTQTKTVNTLAF